MARIKQRRTPVCRSFTYRRQDLKLLYLTRRLSGLSVSREDYYQTYGGDPAGDFPLEMGVLEKEGLLEIGMEILKLTPRGMFYADSVAGLLASHRVRQRRLGPLTDENDPNDALSQVMG